MSDNSLRLVWVYPDLLSTYGDQGNALVVERRARQRGLDVTRVDVRSDQPIPTSGDIYLIGGGEDRPQRLAAERLRRDGGLNRAVANGAIVFSVCAGYQILGHEFVNDLGRARAGPRPARRGHAPAARASGASATCSADIDPQLGLPPLTGFENHQGVTHLGPTARPFARVRLGKRQRHGRRHRGRVQRHRLRHVHARPGDGPQPADRGPAAEAGPRRERAAADRRPLVRGAARRADRGGARSPPEPQPAHGLCAPVSARRGSPSDGASAQLSGTSSSADAWFGPAALRR